MMPGYAAGKQMNKWWIFVYGFVGFVIYAGVDFLLSEEVNWFFAILAGIGVMVAVALLVLSLTPRPEEL